VSHLNGGYSVFAQVVDGMDVVDRISAVPTDGNDKPRTPVRMTKVTITE
jgi:cyclophilin family peptidyl-prolyl cis-trans isomerase